MSFAGFGLRLGSGTDSSVDGASDRNEGSYVFAPTADQVSHLCSQQLSWLFDDQEFVNEQRHNVRFGEEDKEAGARGGEVSEPSWRLKERMKTVGVTLIVCLNIGVDPPDLVKPPPTAFARKQCWYDPLSAPKQKALENIGNALQQQYEKWQPKAKYKACLDPTPEDVRRTCTNLRRGARNDRLLVHYNGHGVPRPTEKGEIWAYGKNYSHYMPMSVYHVRQWLGEPSIYVLDCSGAGSLIRHFAEPMYPTPDGTQADATSSCVVLAACRGDENLPVSPDFPADIFTACLTTPIPIAVRWFILQNPYSMNGVDPSCAENIPGRANDRKTPLGELTWVFTTITDTIAWNTLPPELFQRLFRQDLLLASLFRNFLLARRIMNSMNVHPTSLPELPDTSSHPLWQAWDLAVETAISSLVSQQAGQIAPETGTTLSFFTEHLTAFEVWLEFGPRRDHEAPVFLPVLLQVLLSQAHRYRALLLLRQYLELGPQAVNLALVVGIFPYVLKLLQAHTPDTRQVLVCIWASILAFDPSCKQDLVRDGAALEYFLMELSRPESPPQQRVKVAFILAELMNGHHEGRSAYLPMGLHRLCVQMLAQPDHANNPALRQWLCFCIAKQCESFPWAKNVLLSENIHAHLEPFVINDASPEVRAAALYALGNFSGAFVQGADMSGLGTPSADPQADAHFRHAEMRVIMCILPACHDGSPLVRREAVIALAHFIFDPRHFPLFKAVAAHLITRNQGSDQPERPSATGNSDAVEVDTASDPDSRQSSTASAPAASSRYNFAQHFADERTQALRATLLEILGEHGAKLAESYYTVWLTLREMQFSDPHPSVVESVTTIARLMHEQVVRNATQHNRQPTSTRDDSLRGPSNYQDAQTIRNVQSYADLQQQNYTEPTAHLQARPQPNRMLSPRAATLGGPRIAAPRPMMGQPPMMMMGGQPVQQQAPVVTVNIEAERTLVSVLYDWSRNAFARPRDDGGPEDDPLSEAGRDKAYRTAMREQMANAVMSYVKDYGSAFDNDDMLDLPDHDEEAERAKKHAKKLKLEQYAVLNIPDTELTSAVLFHAFEDVVVVGGGSNQLSVWSLEEGARLKHFSNRANMASSSARMTSMQWINEARSSLLCVGTNDGSVRVWRDVLESNSAEPTLATALNVLPDINPSDRGSGLVVDWLQSAGKLIAGGNSSTIRIWDMNAERAIAAMPTRMDACVTCLASEQMTYSYDQDTSVNRSWFVAGFADGTVKTFDERAPAGHGLNAREHSQWVVSCSLRKGCMEAVTGSVGGDVKFWDLRTMSSYKTIELQRSPMTALAVHNCAPIMASGSHNQFIKVVTLAGDTLNVIRYHDGFLGQRIGPVSCLAFHPSRIMLAAGATDSIVSIYGKNEP